MDYTSKPTFISEDNNNRNVRSDGGADGKGGNANSNNSHMGANQFVTVTPKHELDSPYFHKSQADINQFVCTITLVLILLSVAYKSSTFVNTGLKYILAGLAAWGGYLIYINNMFGG